MDAVDKSPASTGGPDPPRFYIIIEGSQRHAFSVLWLGDRLGRQRVVRGDHDSVRPETHRSTSCDAQSLYAGGEAGRKRSRSRDCDDRQRANRPTDRQTTGYHNVKRGCSGSQKQYFHFWKEPKNIQGALSSNTHVAKSYISVIRRSVRTLNLHRVYNGMFVAYGRLITFVWWLSAKSSVS